jgi:rRNA maturation protein Nop10
MGHALVNGAEQEGDTAMSEQEVVCSECGEAVVVVGYDGDGRPFVREQCPDCGAALDVPDATEPWYSLAEPPR